MAYYVELPNGTYVEVPDDVPIDSARREIIRRFPEFNTAEARGRNWLERNIFDPVERGFQNVATGVTEVRGANPDSFFGLPEDEAGSRIARRQRRLDEIPQTQASQEAFRRAQDADGVLGAVREIAGSRSAVGDIVAESVGANPLAGAVGVAANVTPVPVLRQILGGLAGALGFPTEFASSRGQALLQAAQDAGIDPRDPEALGGLIREINADPARREEIQRNALTRAGIISGVDAVAGYGAGRLATRSAVPRIAGAAAIEGVGGGVGEAAAGLATEGSINPAEVAAEIVGGGAMGAAGNLTRAVDPQLAARSQREAEDEELARALRERAETEEPERPIPQLGTDIPSRIETPYGVMTPNQLMEFAEANVEAFPALRGVLDMPAGETEGLGGSETGRFTEGNRIQLITEILNQQPQPSDVAPRDPASETQRVLNSLEPEDRALIERFFPDPSTFALQRPEVQAQFLEVARQRANRESNATRQIRDEITQLDQQIARTKQPFRLRKLQEMRTEAVQRLGDVAQREVEGFQATIEQAPRMAADADRQIGEIGQRIGEDPVALVTSTLPVTEVDFRRATPDARERLVARAQQLRTAQAPGRTLRSSFDASQAEGEASPPTRPNVPGDRSRAQGSFEDTSRPQQLTGAEIDAAAPPTAAEIRRTNDAQQESDEAGEELNALRGFRERTRNAETYRNLRRKADLGQISEDESRQLAAIEDTIATADRRITALEGRAASAARLAGLGSRSASGTSDRPFRGFEEGRDAPAEGGTPGRDPQPGESQAEYFERIARENARDAQDRLREEIEAEWAARQRTREEAARDASDAERANARYRESVSDPGTADADGFWAVDDNGMLVNGDRVVVFPDQRTAARWMASNRQAGLWDPVIRRANSDEVMLRARQPYYDQRNEARTQRTSRGGGAQGTSAPRGIGGPQFSALDTDQQPAAEATQEAAPDTDRAERRARANAIINARLERLKAMGKQGRLARNAVVAALKDRRFTPEQMLAAFRIAEGFTRVVGGGRAVRLEFRQNLEDMRDQAGGVEPQALVEAIKNGPNGVEAVARFSLSDSNLPVANMTAPHEAFHVLQALFKGSEPKLAQILDRAFPAGKGIDGIDPTILRKLKTLRPAGSNQSYYDFLKRAISKEDRSDELQAYVFGALMDAQMRGEPMSGLTPAIIRMVNYFAQMKRQVGALLRGDGVTAAGIMERAGRGEYAGLERVAEGSGRQFMMAGERGAQNADRGGLSIAKTLEAQGKSNAEIHSNTGWFKGPDGKWRYEIFDFPSRLTPEALRAIKGERNATMRLDEALDHPELYNAYPELRAISVDFDRAKLGRLGDGGRGSFSPNLLGDGPGAITIDPTMSPENIRSVLLHEVQHAVQYEEGFTSGGNPMSMWGDKYRAGTAKLYDQLVEQRLSKPISLEEYSRQAWGGEMSPEVERGYREYLKGHKETLREARAMRGMASRLLQEEAAKIRYRQLGGEIEARVVQRRADIDPSGPRRSPLRDYDEVGAQFSAMQTGSEPARRKSVTDRDPILEVAARGIRDGSVTREQYEALVNERKPVTPYADVPEPATRAEIINALERTDSRKVPLVGKASETLKEGDPVGLRLDIPAYSRQNTWVVSVHEGKSKSFYAGNPIGYEPVAIATNVKLGVVEGAAMKIAAGDIDKATIAVMRGEWQPTTPEEAKARADAALNDPSYAQVGMDPRRHQYFYDRTTKEPVVAADEVIQIGPLVLAKNPVYGNKSDYQFSAMDPAALRQFSAANPSTPLAGNRAWVNATSGMTKGAPPSTLKRAILGGIFGALPGEVDQAQTFSEGLEVAKRAFKRNTVNIAASVERLDQALAAKGIPTVRKLSQLVEEARMNTGRMELISEVGGLGYDPVKQTIVFDKNVPSMLKALQGRVSDRDIGEFQKYLIARREADLRKAGRKGLSKTTDTEIQTAIRLAEQQHPEWRDAAADIQTINRAMLDIAVKTGILDAARAKQLAGMMYTPFYRYAEEDATGQDQADVIGPKLSQTLSNPDAFEKAVHEGGEIGDNLIANMLRNYDAILRSAMKNVAAREVASNMAKLTDANGKPLAERLNRSRQTGDQNVVITKENGKDVLYKVNAPDIYLAMTGLPKAQRGGLFDAAAKLAGWFRIGITSAPSYMWANLIRGRVVSYAQEGLPLFSNVYRGAKEFYNASSSLTDFQAQTGFGGFTFGMGDDDPGAGFMRALRAANGERSPKDILPNLIGGLQKFSEATEMADRLLLAEHLMKKGMSPQEARFQAYLLAPYSRHGLGEGAIGGLMQFLTPLVPFLNSKVQSLNRMIENDKGQRMIRTPLGFKMPADRVLRSLLLTGFSVGAYALAQATAPEEWEKENPDTILRYDIFYVGGQRILIPRAFEFGVAFGALPVFGLEAIRKGETDDLARAVAMTMFSTYGFSPIPQALVPVLEVMTGYNLFQGRPLENRGQQALPAEERVNESTSSLARVASQGIMGLQRAALPANLRADVSPIEVQRLIEGYTGSLGVMLLGAFDSVLAGSGALPARPASSAFGDPNAFFGLQGVATEFSGLKRFIRGQDEQVSRSVGDFYRMKGDLDQLVRSATLARDSGDMERYSEALSEAGAAYGARRQLNRIGDQIGKLNRQIEMIRRQGGDPEDMRERLALLREQRNMLADQGATLARAVGLR